ncbi:MAG: hypothetical protein KDK45_07355, partial [Leptospiraceae bacterium]|nr:hypothetical protein [Leptospiraceae bacterium]
TSIILAENKSSVREVKFGEISESAKLEILRYVEKNLKETVYKLEIQLHKFKKKRRNEERIQAEILQ